MQGELDCEGRILLGSIHPDAQKRLSQFLGTWLEYSADEKAIIARHVQPAGCPALSGVPCELITLLGMVPEKNREEISGGVLFLRNHSGSVLRLLVEKGEVRIQWPHPDYAQVTPSSPDVTLAGINAHEARIRGWAQFNGGDAQVKEIQTCLDRFEGLYPEGEMLSKKQPEGVRLELKDVNIGPKELVKKLKEVSTPLSSLDAELDISSFAPDSAALNFRIQIQKGVVTTVRPALWR